MKKVLKIGFNVIAWIVLILALIVTILVFTADKNNGVATLFGIMPMTVETDSMVPTFKSDDLIFSKEIDDVKDLKVDDVISYWTIIQGQKVKNTHRIVEILDTDGAPTFVTKGDNNDINDDVNVYSSDIIGKWTGVKIGGFGKVMNFLRTKTGFFVCILIPMALFFLFELYKLIVTIVEVKKPVLSESDEEDIKKRAIEEYLAEQKQKEENTVSEQADDENKSE